jgi:hypothetical protein
MQSIITFPARRSSLLTIAAAVIVTAVLPVRSFCQQPAAPAKAAAAPTKAADDDDGDLARKAEIMNSQRSAGDLRTGRVALLPADLLATGSAQHQDRLQQAGRGDVVV